MYMRLSIALYSSLNMLCVCVCVYVCVCVCVCVCVILVFKSDCMKKGRQYGKLNWLVSLYDNFMHVNLISPGFSLF